MAYYLNEINERIKADPKGFIEESDELFRQKISHAADMICDNLKRSPIVLLAGPSGSGKTTTSKKIEEELLRRGISTHAVSMDDYFLTVNPLTTPRTKTGEYDLESPKCMDMDLLGKHFQALANGETVIVPKYEFSRQMRVIDPTRKLRLGRDEIAVFEGIHALNDDITGRYPEAFKLYLSARSTVMDDGHPLFYGHWMRLLRRTTRDFNFRGTSAEKTLQMWNNVRMGEKKNISPFKDRADLQFDSSFAYEVSVLKKHVSKLYSAIPENTPGCEELIKVGPAL